MSATAASDLNLDAWTAIAQHLDTPSLVAAGISSKKLQHVLSNQTLWSSKLRQRHAAAAAALDAQACDWPAACRAAAVAACQLSTLSPWSSCTPRPYPSNLPAAAHLLVTRHDAEADWQPPSLVAALDQRLFWLDSCSNSSSQGPATLVMGDPQHGHSAYVSALAEVAAGSLHGYASGSQDKTIKLWTPSSSSSRTACGCVRPVRTLRSHTGTITALLCLPSVAETALLASASADKTIKLWSLPAMGGSGGGRGNSCPTDDAADVDGNSSSISKARRYAASSSQQQGRSPLLATLRGHSAPVTDLMLAPNDAGNRLVISCGRDGRVKLWDPVSQACVTSWRLQGTCLGFVKGVQLGDAVLAVLSSAGIELVDPRAPAGAAGVLRLQGRSHVGSLTCAAGHGCMLAAGSRKGRVVLWDVRVSGSQSPSASAASCGSVLWGGRMPNSEPVADVHLDRLKLVACTRRAVLHSCAGIGVWSVPDGRGLQQLSSTLTGGIDLRTARAAGTGEADGSAAVRSITFEDAWDLLEAMTETDISEALTIMHQQHQQDEQGALPGLPAQVAPPPPLQQQQHGAAAAEHEGGADAEAGWEDAAGLDAGSSDSGSSSSGGAGGAGGAWGRVEPGVVAMAVDGPVIATVDSLGTILLRDYSCGDPNLAMLQQFCLRTGITEGSCRAVGAAGSQQGGSLAGGGVAGASGSSTSSEAALAVQEPAARQASKFWR